MMTTRIDLVANEGPDNLRDTFRDRLRAAASVSIAVAFVTESGLRDIYEQLLQVGFEGKVRFLTGLYQMVTEPKALKLLHEAEKKTGGNFAVRLSRERAFHRKMYIIENRNRVAAVIGSSNLTSDGMISSGELNVLMQFGKDSKLHQEINRSFAGEWDDKAVSLTMDRIRQYEKLRGKTQWKENLTASQLRDILGSFIGKKTTPHKTDSLQEIKYWLDHATGWVSKRAAAIVADQTNWDKKGYGCLIYHRNPSYSRNDEIFLVNFVNQTVSLVKVKQQIQVKHWTPDGSYFVAYQQVRQYAKKLTSKLWKALTKEGITKQDAKTCRRKITKQKANRLQGLLRPRRKKSRRL